MAPMRALTILLAFLLLSAQQAALSHAISHMDERGLPSEQRSLCDQHDALGTAAGGLSGAHLPPTEAASPDPVCSAPDLPSAQAPGLAPSSRGPPAFL
jgi:hypothetical protein